MVIAMSSQETLIEQQAKEIVNILIDSSLYLEMPLVDRKNLLDFIITAYC